MKRSIRWSILMAVLGFILGLGFLIPVGSEEVRTPASVTGVTYLAPKLEPTETVKSAASTAATDRRLDILFDVHTIAGSPLAKDTDAWVQTWFVDEKTRQEIHHLKYCHNYDYDNQRADPSLSRYDDFPSPKRFHCFLLTLGQLVSGKALITTDIGPVLTLQSKDFDPKTGGTLSLIFAYRIGLFGKDYRSFDMKLKLEKGIVTIGPPGDKPFDWVNLTMHEVFGIPNGVDSFETFSKGAKVGAYNGKIFPKVKK